MEGKIQIMTGCSHQETQLSLNSESEDIAGMCHNLLILVDDHLTLSLYSPSLHSLVLQARYFAICTNLLAQSLSPLVISC